MSDRATLGTGPKAATPRIELDAAALRRAARRVIAYRHAHGTRRGGRQYPMTQEALAKQAGIGVGSVQAFENGTRRTIRSKLERIATACGTTIEALVAPGEEIETTLQGDPWQRIWTDDEAAAVAKMFVASGSEMRLAVKAALRDHLATRHSNRLASTLLHELAHVLPTTNHAILAAITANVSGLAVAHSFDHASVTIKDAILILLTGEPERGEVLARLLQTLARLSADQLQVQVALAENAPTGHRREPAKARKNSRP